MARLPIITGFGGINAAGRSSGHHGYRRMVIDALNENSSIETLTSLAALTGRLKLQHGNWIDANGKKVELATYINSIEQHLIQSTLIRKLECNLFDPDQIHFHRRANLLTTNDNGFEFVLKRKQMPTPLPVGWTIVNDANNSSDQVTVHVQNNFEVLIDCFSKSVF